MLWLLSVAVAAVVAILALVGAGTLAGVAVDWYRIPSFEGGSGFFVIGMALVGGAAGFAIGLVAAVLEARRPAPRMLRALATGIGTVAAVLAVVGAGAFALADIPPQIDGEELFLVAEVRWPAKSQSAPETLQGVPYLRLGAVSASIVRRFATGPLFVTDARQEDGRWIVPGVVPIFTSRGSRMLDFGAGNESIAAFALPLPRYPGDAERQWSGWLPAAAEGAPALSDQFTYRFKVIRVSEALRAERVGGFDIDTVVDYFYAVDYSDRLAARSSFRLRYRGAPIPAVDKASSVAVIAGDPPALFVTISEPDGATPCVVLSERDQALRSVVIEGCGQQVSPRAMTGDMATFTRALAVTPLPGWIDRETFAQPGLFQVDAAVLDTRTLTSASFTLPDPRPNTSIPVLDLSPDEQSFVWLAPNLDEDPRLGVTNWRANRSYHLPIDPVRMRFNTPRSLDPAWVQHHFMWVRESGGDVLQQRPDFVPLPHRGELMIGKAGTYQSYSLRPGGDALRQALVDILVREMGGELLPESRGGFSRVVRVQGRIVNLAVLGTPSYVNVSMDAGDSDPAVMTAVAAHLDAALTTGRYDALFVADRLPP